MNNLVLTMVNGEVTTTTLQVAEVFGKEHKNILSVINEYLAVGNQAAKLFTEGSYENRGKQYPMYTMNRDGWSLLVMGFTGNTALQWKLKYIAAFNAMEKELCNPMNLPMSYPEAMRLLADTYEAKDALEAKLIAMEPKAKAFDIFIDTKGYYSVGTAAKMLNTGRNRLFAFMALHKIIMDNNVPYQRYVDSGYFAVKGHKGVAYVSPKGLQWLSEKMA